MNFWYAPALAGLELEPGRGLPREVIEAVAAESRSTSELEAVRTRAHSACDWDMAMAAHGLLVARKKSESMEAVRTVRAGQAVQQRQQEEAIVGAVGTVAGMWGSQLEQLLREGEAAVRALQGRHEDELNTLRINQVTRAQERGVRPERRSKVLLDLRRSEAVLAAKHEYGDAFTVKVHADALAHHEASGSHKDWLLKCHSGQQQLALKQAKQVEALRKRLSDKMRDAQAARDRDMQRLGRKIEVATTCQQRSFRREQQYTAAALRGNMLNTHTTRRGKGVADSLLTLAGLGQGAGAAPAWTEPSSALVSAYLPPSTSAAAAASARRDDASRQAQGVRFAPTPPAPEAWPARGHGSSGRGNGTHSGSGSSAAASASSSSTSASSASTSSSSSGVPSARGWTSPPPPAGSARAVLAAGAAGAAPSSVAVASGTSAGATGSGSSALTEAAVQEINRAHQARPGVVSLQSSSFKSARPYAAGLSARVLKRSPAVVSAAV